MNRAAVYRCLGHCLNPETAPGKLPAESAWPALLRVGSRYWLLPALATALQTRGLMSQLPTDLTEYLQSLQALSVERNRLLRAQLLHVCASLNDLGVEPLLLKGAVTLVTPLYPGAGDRMMEDLDLLVPASRLDNCQAHLAAAGWDWHRGVPALLWEGKHHAPPLVHADWPAMVELHGHALGRRFRHCLPTEAVWAGSRLVVVEDVRLRLPDPGARLLHNLVHTQLNDGDFPRGRVNLRQLWEWVMLRRCFDDELDWPGLQHSLGANAPAMVCYALAAEGFFGQPLPPALPMDSAGRRAHGRLLRALERPAYRRWLAARAGLVESLTVNLPRLAGKVHSPAWWRFQWRHRVRGRV